ERARNRCRAGAAVGLDDVAIDPDRPFAERRKVRHGPKRSADQPLNLLSAAADLAGGRLALHARARGARQHTVFRSHPPFAGVAKKRRHAVLDARGADEDRKSTRLNSSHEWISYAVFCLKKNTQNAARLHSGAI